MREGRRSCLRIWPTRVRRGRGLARAADRGRRRRPLDRLTLLVEREGRLARCVAHTELLLLLVLLCRLQELELRQALRRGGPRRGLVGETLEEVGRDARELRKLLL
jgi:hypothetical protein